MPIYSNKQTFNCSLIESTMKLMKMEDPNLQLSVSPAFIQKLNEPTHNNEIYSESASPL